MNKTIVRSIFLLFILAASACSKQGMIGKMEHIKTIGNENPQRALVLLDSLDIDTNSCNNYEKAKYELLKIRLNDKAENMPVSDYAIKRVVNYFEINGSSQEKQEVFYYAGSVYRDLKDTPRALEYFYKSLDFAEENGDSLILRNTYSNLCYLFYCVQDYSNSLIMAQKEYQVCHQLHNSLILPAMHIGCALQALNKDKEAKNTMTTYWNR